MSHSQSTNTNTKLVIADADGAGRQFAADLLGRAGFRCHTVASGLAALNLCKSEAIGVLLLAMPLPDLPLQDLPARLDAISSNTAVVVLCDPVPVESVVVLMRAGVCDVIFCPASPERLLRSIIEASRSTNRLATSTTTRSSNRHFLQQLLRAQEAERRRIARDLHDGIGQSLVSIMLALDSVRDAPTIHLARRECEKLYQLTAEALEETRRLARGLRPSVLDDLGLEAALEQLAIQTTTHRSLRVDLHAPTLRHARLPQEIETVVYRIVQEAITNIIKHAKANCVSLIVERRDGYLRGIVEDDGCGFDPTKLNADDPNASLGLVGMRERAELVGGSLTVESGPAGTSVYFHIQLPDELAGS